MSEPYSLLKRLRPTINPGLPWAGLKNKDAKAPRNKALCVRAIHEFHTFSSHMLELYGKWVMPLHKQGIVYTAPKRPVPL